MSSIRNIIRVFPRRTSLTPTDELAFVGLPPLDRPEADEVHVSTVFTWDKPKAEYLAQAWAQYYPTRLGGPAYDDSANGFIPGQYVRQGVTFTSRGCSNQCPWCLVPKREGRLREYEDFALGKIVQDNNLLQCGQQHLDKVWAMLATQHAIELSGGLEPRRITERIADAIRGLRIKQLFLACDTESALRPLELAVKRLQMPRDKVRCYVLLAFGGETISQATARLEDVWHVGAMPFPQLWQPAEKWINYPPEWKRLARLWSRPAITKTMMAYVQ